MAPRAGGGRSRRSGRRCPRRDRDHVGQRQCDGACARTGGPPLGRQPIADAATHRRGTGRRGCRTPSARRVAGRGGASRLDRPYRAGRDRPPARADLVARWRGREGGGAIDRRRKAVAELDPDRAARMLADAVDTAIEDLDIAAPIAERALALLRSDRSSEQLVLLRYGDVLGWKGDAVGAATAWRRSADLADRRRRLERPACRRSAVQCGTGRRGGRNSPCCGRSRSRPRTANGADAEPRIPVARRCPTRPVARCTRRRDRRARSRRVARSAPRGAERGSDRRMDRSAAWPGGGLPLSRARATELGDRTGLPAPRRMGLGVLELAVGRPDIAATVMLANITDMDSLGADAIAPCSFVPSLVEALVRSGRAGEAVPIAREYRSVAERSGLQRAEALALRCRGLAEDSIEDLRTAADMHIAAANPYEAARTQLCLGSMLRRRGKRSRPERR